MVVRGNEGMVMGIVGGVRLRFIFIVSNKPKALDIPANINSPTVKLSI